MIRRRGSGIQSSPFLPPLAPIAIDNLGRVVNPGLLNPDGLVTTAERLDHRAAPVSGPSSYTRQPTPNREGGIFPPKIDGTVGRPQRKFHRR